MGQGRRIWDAVSYHMLLGAWPYINITGQPWGRWLRSMWLWFDGCWAIDKQANLFNHASVVTLSTSCYPWQWFPLLLINIYPLQPIGICNLCVAFHVVWPGHCMLTHRNKSSIDWSIDICNKTFYVSFLFIAALATYTMSVKSKHEQLNVITVLQMIKTLTMF